jgi:hypothetical protein
MIAVASAAGFVCPLRWTLARPWISVIEPARICADAFGRVTHGNQHYRQKQPTHPELRPSLNGLEARRCTHR